MEVKGASQCGQGAGSLRRSLTTCESPRILEATLFDPLLLPSGGQRVLAGDPWLVDDRVGTRAQVPCVNPLLSLSQQDERPSSSWSWEPQELGKGDYSVPWAAPWPLGLSQLSSGWREKMNLVPVV